MQQIIRIGNVDVPIIFDGGEEWFPVSFITTKVLLRSGKNNLVGKHNRDKFSSHLRKYTIEFNENNVQESSCISKTGLIELLQHVQLGRLKVEQRVTQNKLHTYLGIELLPIEEQDSHTYKREWFSEVDEYTKDVIKNELKVENPKWIRMCSKCNNHYPLTSRFFAVDSRANKGFTKTCKVCSGYECFTHQDSTKNNLRKQRMDIYKAMNENQIMKIYQAYKERVIKRLPDCYENKESYEKIIKGLFENGNLNVNNLTYKYIIDECKLSNISRYMSMIDVYTLLFGKGFYLYAWRYPNFKFKEVKLTYHIANQIIKNFIDEHDIIIDDIFTFDYDSLFNTCRIKNITNGDTLGFIIQFYQYQYAGYLFKTQAVNYYKKEENLLFDLKYLIEKDMKIDIEKIPLYLTKYTLQKKSTSLYNFIIGKKNGSLYEWFNKLYPDKFTLHDFEMNGYRNEFDSDKEMYIHQLLTDNFKSVIYNQKHNDRTIKLDEMIPDWFIMNEKGVWVVEYFGLYEERQYGKSSRVTNYIDKTKRKIERYKEMEGYRFIFLYPNDVDDNFKGVRETIEKMKENPYISML